MISITATLSATADSRALPASTPTPVAAGVPMCSNVLPSSSKAPAKFSSEIVTKIATRKKKPPTYCGPSARRCNGAHPAARP